MRGTFYGVGVGPGDSELITVKAVNVIKNADIIITPRTEKKKDSVALNIAKEYIGKDTRIVDLIFPMVQNTDTLNKAWENNKSVILDFLKEGKKVVFLTLGDPMLYSTYIYVLNRLKNYDYQIITVPGITSFSAIASSLNYPLTEGNDILSVVPATNSEEDLEKAFRDSDNLVLMKVYKNYQEVITKLKENNYLDSAVMVTKCGFPEEEVITDLENIGEKKVNYLSTIIARKKK